MVIKVPYSGIYLPDMGKENKCWWRTDESRNQCSNDREYNSFYCQRCSKISKNPRIGTSKGIEDIESKIKKILPLREKYKEKESSDETKQTLVYCYPEVDGRLLRSEINGIIFKVTSSDEVMAIGMDKENTGIISPLDIESLQYLEELCCQLIDDSLARGFDNLTAEIFLEKYKEKEPISLDKINSSTDIVKSTTVCRYPDADGRLLRSEENGIIFRLTSSDDVMAIGMDKENTGIISPLDTESIQYLKENDCQIIDDSLAKEFTNLSAERFLEKYEAETKV